LSSIDNLINKNLLKDLYRFLNYFSIFLLILNIKFTILRRFLIK